MFEINNRKCHAELVSPFQINNKWDTLRIGLKMICIIENST